MKITQISIFLENKKGRLYEVCSLLSANHINIRALTIAETDEFGILRIVVDKPKDAISLLRTNGFVANLTDIVAVEVEDEPGGLANTLKLLSENDINVEYMYGFIEKSSDKAILVFRFDVPDRAISVLTKNKIKVIGEEEIINL
jgi:hypothetical protein